MIKIKKLKTKSFEEKIYNLCDGKNSIAEICQKSGKSVTYVGSVLTRLKRKKLVKIILKNNKKIPIHT